MVQFCDFILNFSNSYIIKLYFLIFKFFKSIYIYIYIFRAKLQPGTEVTFYDRTFKGEEYKDLSEDKVRDCFIFDLHTVLLI